MPIIMDYLGRVNPQRTYSLLTWLLSFITGFKQVHSALAKIESCSQIVQQARSATYFVFQTYSYSYYFITLHKILYGLRKNVYIRI